MTFTQDFAGVQDRELDITVGTKRNTAHLVTAPCLRVETANGALVSRWAASRYLLSLRHEVRPEEQEVDQCSIRVDLPLNHLRCSKTPNYWHKGFMVKYTAVIQVTAQNEPFPEDIVVDLLSRIKVRSRNFKVFVARYNRIARYYGLKEVVASEAWVFCIFGWKITIDRI